MRVVTLVCSSLVSVLSVLVGGLCSSILNLLFLRWVSRILLVFCGVVVFGLWMRVLVIMLSWCR